tara:strand:- start:95 stop:475 length:381 start_codon:yes stop_codon:yes gene_type:complete
MGFVELQNLYPSFDDKVELIARIAKGLRPALDEGGAFPTDLIDILVPLVITQGDPSLYSPQQRRAQKWIEERKGSITIGAPPVVKVAAATVEALAYSTGQPLGDMYTPAIRTYEDSITWSPGGMVY